ncbi:MAG TPA: glycosyltransferase family 2 protein [Candidatus Saccharimonadales bacterium]|nr:glycosyltransferase family 2 protein [Candidatus Saccharimonadales bacterium]
MYRNLTITLCLPCRNEGNHLSKVIKKVPKIVDEIIVVSNKSTDNTVAVAKKLGVKVIEENNTLNGIGYGYAHIAGIKAATSDIIMGADGDGTYPFESLPEVIDKLIDENYDFISCNRYPTLDGTKIPFKLRLGVFLLNTEVYVLYGIRIKDILSGMWVFKRSVRKKLHLTAGDWNLSPQIKINAATAAGIKFGELSIAQHQRWGESHQKYFQTGISHAWWILKHRFSN